MGDLTKAATKLDDSCRQITDEIEAVLRLSREHSEKIARFFAAQGELFRKRDQALASIAEPKARQAEAEKLQRAVDAKLAPLLAPIDIEGGMPPAVMAIHSRENALYARIANLATEIAALERLLRAYDIKGKPTKKAKYENALSLLGEAAALLAKLRKMEYENT